MNRSDEELLAAFVAGEEEAFSALTGRHLKTVYSFVMRFVGDSQDAEDITQETFLKAWKSAKQYREDASKFKTWVLRIARNSAIDHLRKRKHVPFSQFDTEDGHNVLVETVPDTESLPEELFAKLQDAEVVQKALEELSPDAREIMLLHYTNGLTFLEIGEMLGEPQNTVKSRHHRAIINLRKILGSYGGKSTRASGTDVY